MEKPTLVTMRIMDQILKVGTPQASTLGLNLRSKPW